MYRYHILSRSSIQIPIRARHLIRGTPDWSQRYMPRACREDQPHNSLNNSSCSRFSSTLSSSSTSSLSIYRQHLLVSSSVDLSSSVLSVELSSFSWQDLGELRYVSSSIYWFKATKISISGIELSHAYLGTEAKQRKRRQCRRLLWQSSKKLQCDEMHRRWDQRRTSLARCFTGVYGLHFVVEALLGLWVRK